jgi:hypothetical protein
MLDHGKMVASSYDELIDQLESGTHEIQLLNDLYELLKNNLVDSLAIRRYQVYHDCGKPFCEPTEERKYPDHARHSSEQWLTLFPEDVDIAELMRLDMVFHEGADESFYHHRLAPTLYLTAWAEIYANCQMFGGTNSTSFKIKKKKLIQQGKKFIKHLTKQE